MAPAPPPISPGAAPSPSALSNSERRRAAIDKGRNIVICFDGTANSFNQYKTNIVKIFTFLEKETPEQLCYYQTGVGTYLGPGWTNGLLSWFGKVADEGVAWDLDRHVMGGYSYLQNYYNDGDRIYLFGFSRGAYTARALALKLLPQGMLYTVGLLPKGMPEQVPFAYNIFKTGKESTEYKRSFCRAVNIEFLGVFDTVASVGAVYPRVLPFSSDNHITKTFRHAMSLDEHRAKFRSNPWHMTVDPEVEGDDANEPDTGVIRTTLAHLKKKQLSEDERIALDKDRQELDHEEGLDKRPPTDVKEVWFSGDHCDIGGGNAKDSDPHALSNIALRWMLKEIIATDAGLIFRRSALERAGIDIDDLVQAAERTKIEDARHKIKVTQAKIDAGTLPGSSTAVQEHIIAPAQATLAKAAVDPDATLKVSSGDRGTIAHVKDSDDGELAINQVESESLMERWQSTNVNNVPDAQCQGSDALKTPSFWWLLELLPFVDSNQDENGVWKNSFRINLFRPRNIQRPPSHSNPNSKYNPSKQGVSISDAPALFHVSVKYRMESEECAKKSWFGKKIAYRPRAWPPAGDPIYVE
ncbi:hypothetical protein DL93DRAFT_2092864 [Clavulina sp. PMI_390]|nr:hypothetical protein DL93DRAFT_2092864 [Clavulina sp. PMI_390]